MDVIKAAKAAQKRMLSRAPEHPTEWARRLSRSFFRDLEPPPKEKHNETE